MEVCSTGLLFGKEAVFAVVVGSGYFSVFVWVVGTCLAVSGHEVLVGIDVQEIVCYFLYMVVSLASVLCSRVGQERAEAKVDPDVSQL